VVKDGTRRKHRSDGVLTSYLVVLEEIADKKKPSLEYFTGSVLRYRRSPFEGENGAFHPDLSAETTMMEGSFGKTASSSILLTTITEKKEHWYEHFVCLSQSQSSLPVDEKSREIHADWDR